MILVENFLDLRLLGKQQSVKYRPTRLVTLSNGERN
jgi:hypothetical protein